MKVAGTKCWRDSSGEIEYHSGKWLEEGEFPLLPEVSFLYTFVDPPRLDTNGLEIIGQAKKLSNSSRDVFGFDFMIEIAHERWKEMGEDERSKLVWHQLEHCAIRLSNQGDVVIDSCGRTKIYLKKHDLVGFNTFRLEVEQFGLSKGELEMLKFLSTAYKNRTEKNE